MPQEGQNSGDPHAAEGPRERPGMRVGWMSDVGRLRELNEDALCALTLVFEQGPEQQNVGLFALADGMGGYAHGEHASAGVVRSISRALLRQLIAPAIGGEQSGAPLHEVMRDAVVSAHEQLVHDYPGAGTTLTIALALDDSLALAHVGDSRAYLFRKGELRQLTRDHSLVARLVEMGQQSEEEAEFDPRRNVLYRALGQGEALEVDFQFQELTPGDRLLLCSDGLWGQVDKHEIARVLGENDDPFAACEELIDLANDAGGPDNISAIIAIRP